MRELSVETTNELVNQTSYVPDDFLMVDTVSIFGTTYKNNFTIVIEFSEEFPIFSKIEEILISTKMSSILFYCNVYKTVEYDENFSAYEVAKSPDKKFVPQYNLYCYHPDCLYTHSNKMTYVITKCDIA